MTVWDLEQSAQQAAAALKRLQCRVVFAESCTAGLVAASLATVAGVSEYHCGSAVTYRNDTKQRWLGVSSEVIARETAVCATVARQMAHGVLAKTPEALFSFSITGHLGPNAPDGFDGLVFIGASECRGDDVLDLAVERAILKAEGRLNRQHEAAARVLTRLAREISSACAG